MNTSKELSFREKRERDLRERRLAHNGEYGPSYRLTIPENIAKYLDTHDLVPRWINDSDSGRIYDKTQQDTWDFLTNAEVSDDPRNAIPGGERIARRVGTKEDGSPLFTYLCVKPRKWYQEDAARRRKPHDEMMAQIRERPLKTSQSEDLSDDEEHAYIPKEAKLRAKGIKHV
jgi:hypothetical protein